MLDGRLNLLFCHGTDHVSGGSLRLLHCGLFQVVLYVLFLGMATAGFFAWKRSWTGRLAAAAA